MRGQCETSSRLANCTAIHPEERRLATAVGGTLYVAGSLILAGLILIGGFGHLHRELLLAIAGSGAAFGAGLLLALPWRSAPCWLVHGAHLLSLAIIAVVVASSGGARSPAWAYILFPAFFASYFYPRKTALAYLIACVAVQALPLLYYAHAARGVAELLIAVPGYVTIGMAVSTGKDRLWLLRARAETLAAQQGALRRVATAVADGQPAERIYEMVARELAALLRCLGAVILRLEDAHSVRVVGVHGAPSGSRYETEKTLPVEPGSSLERALQSGLPVRINQHPSDAPVVAFGYRATIIAPIRVGGRVWGLLGVAGAEPFAFDGEDEQVLREFGDLLATAIVSTEERLRLATEALTDSLTGLANQRALHDRLVAELARAARHGRPVSVAMIDIDHFKEVNDLAGHDTGNQMLARVAATLGSFARAEDTLGRVGGDEFAWVLPDTTREQALMAVERARRVIAAAPGDPYRISISAGICDTDSALEADELIKLADSALYWSKAHGRNQSWVYDPAVVDELTAQERAARLERSDALAGLRALVRAREGRDPATREHSERVGAIAVALALRAGWTPDRSLLLAEAAWLHDLAVVADGTPAVAPDAARFETDELEHLRAAAERSAQMADGVLAAEQIEWVRGQYASGDTESEGARLLTLADAWDRLTALTPGSAEEAVAACERLAERWGDRAAAEALRSLHAAGELTGGGPAAEDAVGG